MVLKKIHLLPRVSLEDPVNVDFPHCFFFWEVSTKKVHRSHSLSVTQLRSAPQLQIHCSFAVRIKLDPKLPVLPLRPPSLLEILGLVDLRLTPLHMRSFFIVVTQNKYIFIFLHENIGVEEQIIQQCECFSATQFPFSYYRGRFVQ